AACVGAPAIDSVWRDAFLRGSGEGHRSALGHSSCSPSLRDQSGCGRDSLPSRRQEKWRHGRLSLGDREKESAAGTRATCTIALSTEDGPGRPLLNSNNHSGWI